jgi:hypothetical protein
MLKALVLLLSCLLASIAAAATPEQEMEAEAKKLIPTLFSKCGDDYFSKQTFKHRAGLPYVIRQYKDVTLWVPKTHCYEKPADERTRHYAARRS